MKFNKSFLLVLTLVFSFGFLLIPYSCRKAKDIEAPLSVQDEIVNKFFKVPENATDVLRKVITQIKKQDDKHHFARTIATNDGLPAWGKSVSNTKIINSSNSRGLTGDSSGVFFIPFIGADGSVISYLLCLNYNDDWKFRYYRKNELSHLYAASDSIKKLRSTFLSVFGYFEKQINNIDSLYIGGIYGKYVSDVSISFNQSSNGGRVLDENMIRICWLGMLAARTQDPIDVCYSLWIYGNNYDIRWGDYVAGSGLTGGTPSTMFPDGYNCPSYDGGVYRENFDT